MVNSCNLLSNTKIKDEIAKLKEDKLKGAMLEPGDVLQKYIDIAFSDITDFVIFGQEEVPVMGPFGPIKDEDGNEVTRLVNTVKFRPWLNVDGTLISEISQGKDGAKLKLYDKMKALDWLANHMDLLDTSTKEKLDIEKQKVQIARENLEVNKAKINDGNGESDRQGVQDFIKATTMSEEDIKELFKDDIDEQEKEES
jgi:phage terminase small subunit